MAGGLDGGVCTQLSTWPVKSEQMIITDEKMQIERYHQQLWAWLPYTTLQWQFPALYVVRLDCQGGLCNAQIEL
jgi:hypothetical protein